MLKVAFTQAPVALAPITQVITVLEVRPSIAKKILLFLGLTLLGLLYLMLIPLIGLITLGWISGGTGLSMSPE
jgi:hypothetical protein